MGRRYYLRSVSYTHLDVYKRQELDYFLGLVPEDFKSASFNDWTIWDAYARGRLPNKRWSEVFDLSLIHI